MHHALFSLVRFYGKTAPRALCSSRGAVDPLGRPRALGNECPIRSLHLPQRAGLAPAVVPRPLALGQAEVLLLTPRSAPRPAPPTLSRRVLRQPGALLPVRALLAGRGGVGGALAVHLGAGPIRLVSCYTILSRCRLPWPLPSCPDGAQPFLVAPWAPLPPSLLFLPDLFTRVAHYSACSSRVALSMIRRP